MLNEVEPHPDVVEGIAAPEIAATGLFAYVRIRDDNAAHLSRQAAIFRRSAQFATFFWNGQVMETLNHLTEGEPFETREKVKG